MMPDRATIQTIFRHGETLHRGSRVTGFDGAEFHESSFAEVADRIRRLAAALVGLGVGTGDRVASLCWNHSAHLECYFAVPAIGAILNTLNTRLFPGQLRHIIEEMGDRVLVVDAVLVPVIEPMLTSTATVETIIVVGDFAGGSVAGRPTWSYRELIADAPPIAAWPALDEGAAAIACYTSGTTGNPKGIVYSHRSIFMHSLAALGVDGFAISERDRILLLPPMFHSNAWGLPYAAWFAGSALILPDRHLQPAMLRRMITACRPSFTAMVPTLLGDLLQADAVDPIDMSCFRVLVSGGSAVPVSLIEQVRNRWGLPVLQGWGMTETSPLCALSTPPPECPPEAESSFRAKSGRPVPGMLVRLRKGDVDIAWDGVSSGELQLSGPWVTREYHGQQSPGSFTDDGWLRTGDIGTIDPRGFVEITDRAKDVIKSGGEWISSVELEGLLLSHPAVAEVAVIAMPDARWDERPLAVIVPTGPEPVPPEALQSLLEDHVARFWIPEYWAYLQTLPRTGVGKIDKMALREARLNGTLTVIKRGIARRGDQ